MGAAGIARIAAGWDLEAGADQVAALLRATLSAPAAVAVWTASVLA
jgi:hypothetical protein